MRGRAYFERGFEAAGMWHSVSYGLSKLGA